MCIYREGQRTCNCPGLAPTTSPTFPPLLKATKVGICPVYQKRNRDSGQGDTYSPDTNFSRDVFGSVNIDLVEVDRWGLIGYFFEDGADNSARTTPGCPKVEDGDLVPVDLMTDWSER
jgi:hypothetical protein